jgi:aminoglycoside phosphotransferase (APT) family kinase protein
MAETQLVQVDGDGVPVPLRGAHHDPAVMQRVLGEWLAARLDASGPVAVSDIVTPGGTGVANETLMFDGSWHSGGAAHKAGFAVRLQTARPLYIEADIERHARIYEVLADVPGVPVPRVYGYEGDSGLLGTPFFVMERIDGVVPGDAPHWTVAGFVHDAPPDRRRAMWEDAVRVLAALHQAPVSKFEFMASPGMSSGLADHLAWWRRYLDRGSAGSAHDGLERGYEWLSANFPQPPPTGFSWGDSRFANIVFRHDRVAAVLDWDTASLAGAEADLAWWRYMDGPGAALEGIGTPDELVERWQELTGAEVRHLEWHDVFTLFRLGVVMLNLYKNMAADGQLAPSVAEQQGRESAPALALIAALDARA